MLISSVFIGLFAGAQHKLNLRNGGGGRDGDQGNGTQTETKTVTHTTTAATTLISATTTTAVSTAFSTIFDITTAIETSTKTTTTTAVRTSVSTYTTTDHVTRTVIVGPEPTGPPETPHPGPSKVRVLSCVVSSSLTHAKYNRKRVSQRNASFSPHQSWLRWTPLVILVKTFTISLVSRSHFPHSLQRTESTARWRLDSIPSSSRRQRRHQLFHRSHREELASSSELPRVRHSRLRRFMGRPIALQASRPLCFLHGRGEA